MAELRLDLTKVDHDLQGNYDMNQFAPVEYVDPLAEDELLPLQKLKQYCQHEDPGEREMIVRLILDAVDDVKSYADFELVLEIALALANDIDASVRSRVLSTVAALLDKNMEVATEGDGDCQENEERLCEIPLQMMTDFNQQVRKFSQNTIVAILSQSRARDTLIRHLCSVMVRCLGRDENCDIRVDTLLLISRVAALLGRDLCLAHFVPALPFLASDVTFHVRKGLAMCLRDLCPVLEQGTVDNSVLPLFLNLCQDEVWGVRKACAEVYTEVASSCTMENRYTALTPAFLKLLRDDSKWVRKAAYQTLGPFISTFYDPDNEVNKSSSSLEPLGDSILRDNSLLETSALLTADGPPGGREASSLLCEGAFDRPLVEREAAPPSEGEEAGGSPGVEEAGLPLGDKELNTLTGGTAIPEEHLGTAGDGNSIWRAPLPPTVQLVKEPQQDHSTKRQLDVIEKGGGTDYHGDVSKEGSLNRTAKAETGNPMPEAASSGLMTSQPIVLVQHTGEGQETIQSAPPLITLEEDDDDDLLPFLMDLPSEPAGKAKAGVGESSPIRVFVHSENGHMTEHDLSLGPEGDTSLLSPDRTCVHAMSMDLTTISGGVGGSDNVASAFHQEIVPDELMEIYLSIMEQGRAQSSDGELQYHCAFSLPAVVRTLGQTHWQIVKPIFELLAVDQNWKIRRVVAFSLHELARVLGSSLTCSELVPVLMEICTKDIDDVKIGALSHLAEFFELLPSFVQAQKLVPLLHGLLDMENERNWRYRQCLAEQLASLCSILDCDSIQAHISPVALKLAEDKVAEVRKASNSLLGVIVQRYLEESPDSGRGLLKILREEYAGHESYFKRLMYVRQMESFLSEGKITSEAFAEQCLPTLLALSQDRVSNVRLTVARVLKDTILSIGYFKGEDGGVPLEELRQASQVLQRDADRDVRYFAGNVEPVGRKKEEETGGRGGSCGVEGVGSEEELEFFDVEAAKC